MKILTKQQFLKMPPGTIYSAYEPCCFNGFYVKAESGEGVSDFVESPLIGNPENNSSDDFVDKCRLMEKGGSVPIDCEFFGREGLFDDSMLYAVYEKADTEKIIKVLQANPL